ncbi:hypothetical protein ENUP19_0238G0011 [Entamoeba nuttalli]|uniref:Ham1 family protein n=2 Tax=Entamoeba nuttalli TaxID=412467 RepID=K2HQC5_ENTNP|nr:Ham1 family protein [Entamoeba nuttalli P19]EKE38105.1 Ham1 family protein [Entamoeba nuttalli P19]|eukprot:XP_008859561.1 Ham1 family protein [Entamoeba nuttalli P19]
MEVRVVTSNPHKAKEINEILKDLGLQIGIVNINLMEIQETPLNIIEFKAKEAIKHSNTPVIVEDVSFNLKCMGELPGPYIKYFVQSIGPAGLYKMAKGFDDYRAQAILSIGLTRKENDEVVKIQAIIEGKVVEPRGSNGFGFDSCFVPEGYDKTYAEMSESEKNQCSHRGVGYRKLAQWLKEHPNYFK